jgi:DNA-binding CsgD family transcriptional regulator
MTAPVQVGPPTSGPVSSPAWEPTPGAPLSERQLEVLTRIANGQSWEQIARAMDLSIGGVGSHNKQILKKLGASSAAHAVFLACRAGILDPRRRHGDHAGFAAHRYYGEDPCEACWDGEREYRRERRGARKAARSSGT